MVLLNHAKQYQVKNNRYINSRVRQYTALIPLLGLSACGGGGSSTPKPQAQITPPPDPISPVNTDTTPHTIPVAHPVSITGNNLIDGLLGGTKYAPDPDETTTTLTFSFPGQNSKFSNDPNFGYEPNTEPHGNLTSLSQAEQTLFISSLAHISSFANLTFVQVDDKGNSAGIIRILRTDNLAVDYVAAYTFSPQGRSKDGDIWLSSTVHTGGLGSKFHHFILHELGHVLGLKHPHNYGNDSPILDTAYDGYEYTVMSYNDSVEFPDAEDSDLFPQSYMYLDILALQYIYGAIEKETGDNIYRFLSNERYYFTLWDTGGNDTLDASEQTVGLHLDLTPGSWSNVGTVIHLSNDTSSFYKTETVFIPEEITIENAIGGSGNDKIIGNAENNILTGGGGSDTFVFGADFGEDIITDFENSTDLIDLRESGLSFEDLTFSEIGANTIISAGEGNTITLNGISLQNITVDDFIFG